MLPGVIGLKYIHILACMIGQEKISAKSYDRIDWGWVESEYKLIQEKKSILSSVERNQLIELWERREAK